MVNLILSIVIVSALGILAFFILFNYALQRSFHIHHVYTKHTPKDFGFEQSREILIETGGHKRIEIWDLNPSKAAPVIIGVHGWANTSEKLLPIAQNLADRFRIVLVNTRNHGKSDDEKYSTLINYSEDLLSAITYAAEKTNGKQPIFLMGHSMGGAACIYTAGKDNRVKGVVSISTFANLNDIMSKEFLAKKVPPWFVQSLTSYIEFRLGVHLNEISPEITINRINIPVLILHGNNDPVVDVHCSERIEQAARDKNVKRIVLQGHDHSSLLTDEKTVQIIKEFLTPLVG